MLDWFSFTLTNNGRQSTNVPQKQPNFFFFYDLIAEIFVFYTYVRAYFPTGITVFPPYSTLDVRPARELHAKFVYTRHLYCAVRVAATRSRLESLTSFGYGYV